MMRIQRSATSQIFQHLIPCLGRKTTTANTLQAPSQSLIQCSRSHGFWTLKHIIAAYEDKDAVLIAKIKNELASRSYSVLPHLLRVDCSGVHVHKDGLNQNMEQFFASEWDWNEVSVSNKKLKAHGYGDSLTIGCISAKHFESREKFDSLWSHWSFDPEVVPIKVVDKISLEQVLAEFDMTLAFDMEYYLSSQKDLGLEVQELDVDGKSSLNLPESQLFCREMAKIFGEQSADEGKETNSSVYFNDFRVLHSDGNRIAANATRGEHYFSFDYFFKTKFYS